MIRLLIADDHLVVRERLRALLETAPDVTLVGEAGDGDEAVRLTAELSPDLVLMDLRMPGVGCIEAIRRIKARDPSVEIVVLTTYDEDDQILAGLRAGARGYLSRTSTGRSSSRPSAPLTGARCCCRRRWPRESSPTWKSRGPPSPRA